MDARRKGIVCYLLNMNNNQFDSLNIILALSVKKNLTAKERALWATHGKALADCNPGGVERVCFGRVDTSYTKTTKEVAELLKW